MRIQGLKECLRFFPDNTMGWDLSKLEDAEASLRRGQPAPTESWDAESLEKLSQIIRIQLLRDDMDGARESINLLERQLNEQSPQNLQLRYYLERGRFLTLQRQPSQAHNYFMKAWTMAKAASNDDLAIDAALMMAINQPPKSEPSWLSLALSEADNSQQPLAKKWLPLLHSMQAWKQFDLHAYKEAELWFRRALEHSTSDSPTEAHLSIRWGLGRTLRELKQYDAALSVQNKLLEELRSHPSTGYIYLEIAECMQLMGKETEAKAYFEEAHTALSTDEWFIDNKKPELDRMKSLIKKTY